MHREKLEIPGEAKEVTFEIARIARAVEFSELSSSVIIRAKHCLLDWLGATIAGAHEPAGRIVREALLDEAGPPQASVFGAVERMGASQAALANGTASHALDFDDVSINTGSPLHPSAPVIPALLALAERNGASGPAFLAAFVAAVETEARVGLLVAPGHYQGGWHATATVGTFGAASGCAHLLSLDLERWCMALGIAATQAAGLKAMFGTMCKPLHAGKAAASGLLAALLAERGFTSSPEALETPQGFGWTQTTTFSPELALSKFDEGFAINGVIFKKHAACFGTHSALEGILRLQRESALRAEEVEKVVLRVPTTLLSVCNISEPKSGLEAKFSLRFASALVLSGGDTTLSFTDEKVREPELMRLQERVVVEARETGGSEGVTEVHVSLTDGRVLSAKVDVYRAARDDELGEQRCDLITKFRKLVIPILGEARASSLVEQIDELETASFLRTLASTACRER